MFTRLHNKSPLPHENASGRIARKTKSKTIPLRNNKKQIKTGRWETGERILFLQGLRHYGKGKWKKISDLISTRNAVQVKTHGQVVLRNLNKGVDVFAELNRHERHAAAARQKQAKTTSDASDAENDSPFMSPECRLDPEDYDAARILVSFRK